MSKKKKKDKSLELLESIIEGMQEKKGKEIVTINLTNIHTAVCDYFVICHGDSNTHVDAIADSVDEFVKKRTGENPFHTEGYENAQWILLDYFNIVVHVFQKEARDFYGLERLWADAELSEIADIA